MGTELIDRTPGENSGQTLDFLRDLLQASTEYSIIEKDLDGTIRRDRVRADLAATGGGEDAMQRADTRRAASEAEDRAAPCLVRSTPLGDRQEASSATQHAATDKREYRRQGMPSTSGASMIRHRRKSDQYRR